jgi:hypothetical protein
VNLKTYTSGSKRAIALFVACALNIPHYAAAQSVAVFGVELESEPSDIALRIGCPAFPRDGRKAREHQRLGLQLYFGAGAAKIDCRGAAVDTGAAQCDVRSDQTGGKKGARHLGVFS